MSGHQNRSAVYVTKPYGYGHAHASVAGLQVIQYRSYQRDIHVYHLKTDLLYLNAVRKALQRLPEFQNRSISHDPVSHFEMIEGDEIPAGCIEAIYMPNVLRGDGSTLALRVGGNLVSKTVEWYVFNGPIDETFLSKIVCVSGKWKLESNISPNDHQKVFDLVGYAEKGLKTRTVRGANREHKGWHDTLCASRPVRKKTKPALALKKSEYESRKKLRA